jgi:serine/threonine-protein kinase PpkA
MEIPGYTIDREIGQGAMAVVYLATQQSLGRPVALKVIKPALTADEDFTKRFLREGRIIAQLIDPRIVTIFDIGSHGTLYYLAMEYLPGGTLADRIRTGLNLTESLSIARTIAGALSVAHQQGFVHRDIKPQNILFRDNGAPVLTDFGVAKALNSSTLMTKAGVSLGTPRYMSPEQIRGLAVDARSDWYSFGVLFYEMLTGRIPFAADDSFALAFKHLTEPVPSLPTELAVFQPILDKLLAKDPAERYSSSEQFIAALERTEDQPAAGTGAPGPEAEAAVPSRPPAGGISTRQTALVLGVLAALLIGGAYWFSRQPAGIGAAPGIIETPRPPDQAQTPGTPEEQRFAAGREYLAVAEQELRQGALESAQRQIALGLQIAPEHPELLALRASIQAMQEAQRQAAEQAEAAQRQQQAQELLTQAQQLSQAGDLQGSLQAANEGLARVPDHPELLALQQDVAARQAAEQQQAETARRQQQAEQHLAQARVSLRADNLEASLAAVERGLVQVPNNPDLLAMRSEIITRQAQAQPPVAAMLAECAGHVQANRLTTGRGGNALACYTEVLRQDPGNAQAQAGLQRIAERYIGLAESALRQSDVAKADSFLDRLEQVNPRSPQLAALRAEAARVEAAARAREAEAGAQAEAAARAEAEERARIEAQERARRSRVFDDTNMRTR